MTKMIEVKAVNKKYGHTRVLRDVSISVESGQIYGFIGENGAGKTTLIRYLLGLIPDSKGDFIDQEALKISKKDIGVLIERPALIENMNAIDNLTYQQLLYDRVDYPYLFELLKIFKLEKLKAKKAKNYSLGMKQRLGIALALCTRPKLLILDEPVNGLDPSGMHEVRDFLIKLNQEGTTVFMSTHILSELEMMATRYCIIHKGKIMLEASPEELSSLDKKTIALDFSDNNRAYEVFFNSQMGYVLNKGKNGVITLTSDTKEIDYSIVFKIVEENELVLMNINTLSTSLEDYFIKVVKGDANA